MPVNIETYKSVRSYLDSRGVTLVAVSKTKPIEDILALYDLGQRDFGENYVQELVEKAEKLPASIRWHFIGHLQSNKVKYIAPFVQLIHGVDSYKLLEEINKQAIKNNRVIDCLLQVHIATEETKFGFAIEELHSMLAAVAKQQQSGALQNVRIGGLMGMASFTDDVNKIKAEFRQLNEVYRHLQTSNQPLQILSMGMSSDYKMAMEEGSTLVRIGSLLFGERAPK